LEAEGRRGKEIEKEEEEKKEKREPTVVTQGSLVWT
jgi:hypothetical protein